MSVLFSNRSENLKTLLDQFAAGTIQIPEIQRDVVWDIDRVKDFMDTVYSGFPCGSFVFWKPSIKNEDVFELVRPERIVNSKKPEFLIVDGQQRLTALVHALLGPDVLRKIAPEYVEDFERDNDVLPFLLLDISKLPQMQLIASDEAPSSEKALRVPLFKIFDQTYSTEKISLSDKQKTEIREFRDKIVGYPVTVQEIGSQAEYETVAEIFYRINSQGMPLTNAEIHLAQIVPHWRGITKEFRQFLNKTRDDFGFDFDLSLIMKCLAAQFPNAPDIKRMTAAIKKKGITTLELQKAWQKTCLAIGKAINLLREEHVHSTRYCTSMNVFVPIVAYLSLCEKPVKKEILKFFFLAQLGSHFETQSDRTLKQDIKRLKEDDCANGLKEINKSLEGETRSNYRKLRIHQTEFSRRPTRNPLMSVYYAILLEREACDLVADKKRLIKNLKHSELHLHHIFPRNLFAKKNIVVPGFETRSELMDAVNSIANLTIIARDTNSCLNATEPASYLTDLIRENLKQHFIPPDPKLWKLDRFHEFLEARKDLLSAALTKALAKFVSY